jgi:hypothetical protein
LLIPPLLIPPLQEPYSDYDAAKTAIDDLVSNCAGFIELPTSATLDSFVADLSVSNQLDLASDVSGAAGTMAAVMYSSLTLKAASSLSLAYVVAVTPTCTPGDAIPCLGESPFSSSSYSGNTDFGGGRSIDYAGTLTWISGTTYSFTGSATLVGAWGSGAAVTAVSYGGDIPNGDTGSIPACADINVSIWATVTGGTHPSTYLGTGHSWSPPGYANYGSASCGLKSITATLYTCDGAQLEQQSATGEDADTGTFNFSIALDGEYIVKIEVIGEDNSTTLSSDVLITSTDTLWVNPVIALWDDSGTTRSLWACPKLILPPLTESTGDWYADCAAAADDITDFSSNCFGYFEPSAEVATFSANGGGSLNYDFVATTVAANTGVMWGSFNADSGDIITVAQDGDPGGIFVQIYDYDGVLVEDFSTSSGVNSVASSALPYTGRYTIKIQVIFPPPAAPFTSLNVDVTSSGSLDPNSIQARYDLGLTCAGLLNCGDSCP